MIVWLRGPSGSGKSTVAHRLLERYPPLKEVFARKGHVLPGGDVVKKDRRVGYVLAGDLFVIGNYEPQGGGMDGLGGSILKTQMPIVKSTSDRYRHVFVESLTASNVVPQRFTEWRDTIRAEALPLFMPVLDTPLDVCIASIYERQMRRMGKTRQVNEEVIRDIGKNVFRYQALASDAGLDAPLLPRETALETIVARLKENGWNPTA